MLFVLIFICLCFNSIAQVFDSTLIPLLDKSTVPFAFGVASGDPQTNSVILWTKLHLQEPANEPIKWEIATDTQLLQRVNAGEVFPEWQSAYTVKLKATGLQPNTTYYYRFQYKNSYSPVGRTKTTPENTELLKLAVVSCSNYEAGYFNAYRLLTFQTDISAVIHLGDYIYESGSAPNPDKPKVRYHIPPHEIVSLRDYRTRYAQYRLDADLQEAHRLHPFVTTWDDHEFANNSYSLGAQNHQSNEGNWEARKQAAKQAYFEWMPISPDSGEPQVIRQLSYGSMAELWMLDTRIEARAKQLTNPKDPELKNLNQTILGKPQADWLIDGMIHSKARWRLLGNQVVFSDFSAKHISKKYQRNLDAWDGYPTDRNRIMDSLYAHHIQNVVVLTGDIHSSWAFDLACEPRNKKTYRKSSNNKIIGAEMVVTSITSTNADERVGKPLAKFAQSIIKNRVANPHLRYVNIIDHGFLLLELTDQYAKGSWLYTPSVKTPSDKVAKTVVWQTNFDNNHLHRIR